MNQQIVVAQEQHTLAIVQFQLKMALQTQNFHLNPQIVNKAVSYFISLNTKEHLSHLGFYLVKLVDNKVVGSLLLTFQSSKRWWIQSVFIDKLYRRQGHFTSLFNRSIQIAKENGVESVKLYAESANQNAKQAYFKLGMSIIQGNFYSYDFVYGGLTLQEGHKQYEFISNYSDLQIVQKWVVNKLNALNDSKSQFQSTKDVIVIKKNGNIIGVAKYFEEFSDWRFGIMRYIGQIYLSEPQSLQQIIPQLINYLVSSSEIKVAVVRFIVNQQVGHKLKGGHLQHYDILQIKLK